MPADYLPPRRLNFWQRLAQRFRMYRAAPQMFAAISNAEGCLNWADECAAEMMLGIPQIRADLAAALTYVETGRPTR